MHFFIFLLYIYFFLFFLIFNYLYLFINIYFFFYYYLYIHFLFIYVFLYFCYYVFLYFFVMLCSVSSHGPVLLPLTYFCDFSVRQRAKVWTARPSAHQTQERLRQEAARANLQDFAKEQQSCGVKNRWLASSQSHFQRQEIERRIQECLKKMRSEVEDRKKRFTQAYILYFGVCVFTFLCHVVIFTTSFFFATFAVALLILSTGLCLISLLFSVL